MANRNSAGFGFVAAGTLGNTPSSQGLSEYFIDAGDSANKFNGMAVRVTAGYIVTGEDSATGTTVGVLNGICLLYTSPSPRDGLLSRMPSSA